MGHRILFRVGAAGLLLSGLSVLAPATAQEFPTRPITLVEPNGPGGVSDIFPRIMAPAISKILGQPVVVVNKPGAGNLLGYDYVATQVPADGYNILVVTSTGFSILPLTVKDLKYDPLKELPPLSGMVQSKLALVSSVKEPFKTFQEMVAYGKANPGKMNYASSSASTQLQTEAMVRAQGLKMVYVPYSTTGAGTAAILSGEVEMGFMGEAQAIPLGDQVRVLAVTGDKRSKTFPDAPTFVELGMPQIVGFDLDLNVRAGTPKPIMDKLRSAISQALKQPDVQRQAEANLLDVIDLSPEEETKTLVGLSKSFTEVAQQIGLKPQ